jgi:hypothetical protein
METGNNDVWGKDELEYYCQKQDLRTNPKSDQDASGVSNPFWLPGAG